MNQLKPIFLCILFALFTLHACTPKVSNKIVAEPTSTSMAEEAIKNQERINDEAQLEILKDLRASSGNELSQNGEPVVMDPETTPFYSPEGVKLTVQEMASFLTSGEYIPVPYVNDEMELKLFLLKEATEEQKLKMAQMKRRMDEGNEIIGTPAKSFETKDMEDHPVILNQYKGKVVVINFWFINCKPCVMEMPDLNKLVKDYKDQEVVFLAFSPDSKVALEKFRSKKAFDYQIIPSSNEVIKTYQIQGYPTHVILDKEGLIQHHETGLSQNTIYDLRDKIDELLE